MRGVEIVGWVGWLILGCEGIVRCGDQLEGGVRLEETEQ